MQRIWGYFRVADENPVFVKSFFLPEDDCTKATCLKFPPRILRCFGKKKYKHCDHEIKM